jgi:hypothetical protein
MGLWATPKSGVYNTKYISDTPDHSIQTHRHLNIGAGRIVWQDIVKIDVSIAKRQFHKNEMILASMKRAKDGNGRLHLLGLVST